MTIYYIYHVFGRKVGCTKDIERRMCLYEKAEGQRPIYEILEEFDCVTDQEAGDREWWWADRFGYKRKNHYVNTMNAYSEGGKIGGRIGGRKAAELGLSGFKTMTPQQRALADKRSGLRQVELGLGIHSMSKDERIVAGRKGGAISGRRNFDQGKGIWGLSSQERSEIGRKGGKTLATCPHCGKDANAGNIGRWHLDNCPKRPRLV